MNLISVETNVAETGELEAQPTGEAIAELSAAQLMLVGGGCGVIEFG